MRLDDFQKALRREKISAAVVSGSPDHPNPNFVYLTGFFGSGILLVTPRRTTLLVPEMEFLSARQSRIKDVRKSKDFLSDYLKFCRNKNFLGIDKDHLSVNSFSRLKKRLSSHKVKFRDISAMLSDLRRLKTRDEIRILRKACRFTDDIFHKVFVNFRDFYSESDVASFLVSETFRLGLEPAFNPIVASGSHASKPHHVPSTKKLKKGFCVIDYGVRYRGLCSDMTRTIYIGKPAAKEIELYHKVFDVQRKAIGICSPGRSYHDIDLYTKKMLGSLGKHMCHSVGHGIGFEPHEPPFVRRKPDDSQNLDVGSAFTIEPGIYIPNRLGIRIEDTVHMKGSGCIPLTKTGKNLLIIRER